MTALAHPELETIEDFQTRSEIEPVIPCRIHPEARSVFCHTAADHDADVQVIVSCGCVFSYCRASYEKLFAVDRTHNLVCGVAEHHDLGAMSIVAIEWLK